MLGGVVCGGGAVLHGAWQFVAGDDFQTLSDPNASFGAKAFALVDLGSNATLLIPIVGEGAEGIKFGAKGLYYVGRKLVAREFRREEVEKALRRGFRLATRDTGEVCECFPANTRVATAAGAKAIGALHAGDTVLAENPEAGKVETERVQAVIKDGVKPLMAIALSDGSTITVTANHPFWLDFHAGSRLGGWIAAGQLRPGDQLRTARGTDVSVVALKQDVGHAVVYTLTVAHDHTFFVGAARVLVHNCPLPGGRSGGIRQTRFTPNQEALIALAKQAQRTGVSRQEADTLLEWARELGVRADDHTSPQDAAHWVGGPHIRIGPVNHIPVHP